MKVYKRGRGDALPLSHPFPSFSPATTLRIPLLHSQHTQEPVHNAVISALLCGAGDTNTSTRTGAYEGFVHITGYFYSLLGPYMQAICEVRGRKGEGERGGRRGKKETYCLAEKYTNSEQRDRSGGAHAGIGVLVHSVRHRDRPAR
jgi:hypothetical protein